MSIFFAFSDESGDYGVRPEQKFISRNPYYVRATFVMRASEWKTLNQFFRNKKTEYDLPVDKEIKWSWIWQLYLYQRNNQTVSPDKSFYFLSRVHYQVLLDFVDSILSFLPQLTYHRIILTVTCNHSCPRINESDFYKMHMQELMQRVEMELQNEEENLCILFIDPVSPEKNRLFRDIYFELYKNGDFIDRYSHIKDSLNLEYSHHSVGIQVSDYIAGCLLGSLRGYTRSKEIFDGAIKPSLRKRDREIMGFGIREVPRNDCVRNNIAGILNL